jgi:hypothetical protein
MEFTVTIKKDGKVVHEVTNRQEHLCEDIYKVTNRMGTQLSDEELPDCAPTVHETTST